MNEPLTIDPEFQSLIPPLSEDEFSDWLYDVVVAKGHYCHLFYLCVFIGSE